MSNDRALTVLSTNICFIATEKKLEKIVDFIISKNPDIIFLQEAWGYIADITNGLKLKNEYINASFCPIMQIIIKDGVIIPNNQLWPKCSLYSTVKLIGMPCCLTLVNVHLWDEGWLTTNNSDEEKYRISPLQHILRDLPVANPRIIAGDFNSPSHYDIDINNSSVNSLLFTSKLLDTRGYKDCWIYQKAENKDTVIKIIKTTWPARIECPNIKADIDSDSTPIRIDRIYISNDFNSLITTVSLEHLQTDDWYSDHLAVVAKLLIINTSSDDISYTNLQWDSYAYDDDDDDDSAANQVCQLHLNLREVTPWSITASGLNAHQNGSYIEVTCINSDGVECEYGWFYINGLKQTVKQVLTNELLYHYHSIDFNKLVPHNCSWKAELFNWRLCKIADVNVCVT